MSSHAIAVQGPGATTARVITQIGSDIVLPAGGPWTIYGLWGQVVKKTTVPDEGTGGELIVTARSGDISPNPAPGVYPIIGSPVSESANAALSAVPLNIWPVNWSAAGKAIVQLFYRQQLAITTASEIAAGIFFGDAIPEKRPLVFCDAVQLSWASASEAAVGTITLSEKATRIVGILADLNKSEASTTAEEVMATIRLASDDINLPPSQYPCNRAFNASDGTAVGQSAVAMSNFIPVDIPVEGGARINITVTSSVSVTGNADIAVFLAYE